MCPCLVFNEGKIVMRINLKKDMFSDREFVLVENGVMKATAFKYSTGIEALKVENEKGYFIILPFQGQQIWRVNFLGKDLTMKTKIEEPISDCQYLETYGGFLLHCGISGIGSPKEGDDHLHHGELPNIGYQTAYIECGDDYILVGGEYKYDKSFVKSYSFSPECKLCVGDTVLKITVNLENRRETPLEYMYLCHINFRPVDGAQLVYSADYKKTVVCRGGESGELERYMDELEKNPELHHKVGAPNQVYAPEICFLADYFGDENNRAYTLQYTDDGACYVSHDVKALPFGVRWISRTGDEDSMGMILPATAEHLGYNNAKKKGQVKILAPKSKLTFTTEAGYLDKSRADAMKDKIETLRKENL